VVLEGLFDGVGGLALALEVIGVVFDSRPATVITARLSLQVGSLFIIENPSEAISHARGKVSNTLQWTMPLHRVDDVLPWSSPQGLLVRILDRRKRAILGIPVPSDARSVVRALMVVSREARLIETVDDVGALEILLPKMGRTVSNFLIMTYYVKGSVRLVTRKALFQRVIAGPSLVRGVWWRVAGSSRPALV